MRRREWIPDFAGMTIDEAAALAGLGVGDDRVEGCRAAAGCRLLRRQGGFPFSRE